MRKALLAAMLLGVGGCNYYYNEIPSPDDLMHAVPWFDHMILSKAVHPYQRSDIPRNTPPGAVPVGGGERDWRTGDPKMMSFAFDTLVANKLKRPVGPAAPAARSGEEVYNIYCSACHNYNGDAKSPASELGVAALSLLTAQARNFTDGYIYSMIRYGRGRMPQYGDKIVRPDERWAVVDYVRTLQSMAPLPPVPPTLPKGAH